MTWRVPARRVPAPPGRTRGEGEGLLVVDGLHAVKHAVRFGAQLADLVALDPDGAARDAEPVAPDLVDVLRGARRVGVDGLRALAGGVHPTGVAALASRPEQAPPPLARSARAAPAVLVDRPRHPGNVGAVVRVAAAVGASGVLVTGDVDPWGAAAVRGAAGLAWALSVHRVDEDRALAAAQGPVVVLHAPSPRAGRHGSVPSVAPAALPADALLVVGSERDGVSAAWRERADAVLELPMRDGVSSLNLATAVAGALYAWRCAGLSHG